MRQTPSEPQNPRRRACRRAAAGATRGASFWPEAAATAAPLSLRRINQHTDVQRAHRRTAAGRRAPPRCGPAPAAARDPRAHCAPCPARRNRHAPTQTPAGACECNFQCGAPHLAGVVHNEREAIACRCFHNTPLQPVNELAMQCNESHRQVLHNGRCAELADAAPAELTEAIAAPGGELAGRRHQHSMVGADRNLMISIGCGVTMVGVPATRRPARRQHQ